MPLPGAFPDAMKQCPNCGSNQPDETKYCAVCGSALPDGPDARAQAYAPAEIAHTRKEFLSLPENAGLKKQMVTSAIFCYVCAGITLAVAMFTFDAGNYYPLIGVALLLGLGLAVHLGQSRVCAVILCAYGVLNAVIGLVQNGRISGYLILLAGVYAVISTFKLDKQWKEYRARTTGM